MNPALFDAVAPHIVPFVIVFSRLTGLFLLAPILGGESIPRRIKALLAIALTLIVYPTIPVVQQLPIEPDLISLLPIMATEILIGLSVGALAMLPILAVQAGGQFISQQMALSIASVFDPTTNADSDLVSRGLTFILLTSFLAMGGLELMITAIVRSFDLIPLGQAALTLAPLDLYVGLMAAAYEVAIRIAAPVVCIIFVETLSTGMIMKTVPQLNILSFGFPIKILVGLGMLAGSLVFVGTALGDLLELTFISVINWIESLGTAAIIAGGIHG